MSQIALDQLHALKAQVAEVDRQRAAAEATRDLAARRLAEIDAQLTDLKVDPAKAEAELAALDAKLAADLEALRTALAAELTAYQQILAATK